MKNGIYGIKYMDYIDIRKDVYMGNWVKTIQGNRCHVFCNRCKKEAIRKIESNYCPHCGERMSEKTTYTYKSTAPIGVPASISTHRCAHINRMWSVKG